jgi:DNA-directed RNA polymerase specialized sigma24 family protein
MLFLSKNAERATSHEDLFVERYDRLFRWSLQLTDNDRSLAEDLLHDTFILFTLNQPDLGSVRNLDAYLHTMLRNLHLSQMRRATRSRFQQLSILDYDSAEVGLWAIDPRDQIHAQDELRHVCHYACARKQTAKLASILILRFFHGYYPSEIVQILRTSRKAADRGLLLARGEAKASLNDPQSLGFIVKNQIPEILPADFARTTEGFLRELRQTIFQSRQGECLSTAQLKVLYQSRKPASLPCEYLAHIVSCARCLDEVNSMLGLPRLSERYPVDTMNKDSSSKGGPKGGTPSGNSSGSLSKWKREARAAFEHKPKELCIAVNGYIQGSQMISSERMEQSFIIDMPEKIGFVEVFSEQGIRLLLLNIDEPPPTGPGEHAMRVGLSDERALELSLRFSNPWPTIHVTYSDPALKPDAVVESELVDVDIESSLDLPSAPSPSPSSKRNPFQTAVSRCRQLFVDWRFWMRPGTVTVLLALLMIAAVLLTHFRGAPTPTVSAVNLLADSIATEETLAALTDLVIHRTVDLEERRGERGDLIARSKMEIWQSGEKGISARRLYNEQNQLVAGDWRRADGVETIYHHGARPQLQLTPEKRGNAPVLSFDRVWQLSLSAKDFSSLVGNAEDGHVEEQASQYVISYGARDEGSSSSLLKATLILNRNDLHPVEQTFLIKQGNETREFRFVEAAFERWSPGRISPATFEPDPELLSSAKPETLKLKAETSTLAPGAQPVAPVIATSDLEVEVLHLLHQAGADLGEQVSVERTAQGLLQIKGIVETDKRKAELLQMLGPVSNNPALRVQIKTVAEALKEGAGPRSSSSSPIVERLESSNDSIPLKSDLRQWFLRQGLTDTQAEVRVSQFADQTVNRSSTALQHAWALKRLAERWSPEQLRTLDSEARAKWLTIIRAHVQAIQRETANVRQGLQPIFGGSFATGAETRVEINNDADLVREMEQLFKLCLANDEVIRAGFTISPDSGRAAAVKSSQFWQSLREAEKLASNIEAGARQ